MTRPTPTIVLTRQQVREVDRRAIEQYGIPGIVLMENAARNAARIILETVQSPRRIAIVCGRGNNGGDGFAIARHLANQRLTTELFLACDPDGLTGDAATNHRIVANMGLKCHRFDTDERIDAARPALDAADLIIDALLGTGFSGQVRSPLDRVIRAINEAPASSVIAIDVPSGLDCDTGRPSNATVRARLTVTFVARKAGFDVPGAAEYVGRVHVADIGAPHSLPHDVWSAKTSG